jgi:hypothetical protein
MLAPLVLFNPLRHCVVTTLIVLLDLGRLVYHRRAVSLRTGSRESVPPEAVGAVSGAKRQGKTDRRFHPVDHGYSEPDVCVARCTV